MNEVKSAYSHKYEAEREANVPYKRLGSEATGRDEVGSHSIH